MQLSPYAITTHLSSDFNCYKLHHTSQQDKKFKDVHNLNYQTVVFTFQFLKIWRQDPETAKFIVKTSHFSRKKTIYRTK